jgi:tRNA threonylcarbamoyl adenosine modification protein (Sua5/YciO/YrdC/YwlC family)
LSPTLVRFNPSDPNLKQIREVAQSAREGKIIAFPTETVYGIGVPCSKTEGLEKLYQIKGRDRSKPFAYHIGDWDQLGMIEAVRTPSFRHLSKKFWPGPVTLIAQGSGGKKVGIRYPRSLPTCTLIVSAGEPFFATSANRSGEPSPKTAQEVLAAFGNKIDVVIDAGPCQIGLDSTVVDVSSDPPAVLREGAELAGVQEAIEEVQSGRVPRKKILVVCTGNSCRSPMMAGLLHRELRRKHLDGQIEIMTCGILARDGGSATTEAVYVMKNREIDISSHRTRSCRKEDVLDADLILAMDQGHCDFLVGLVPAIKDKVRVLGITDPIGLGISIYEEVIEKLEEKLKNEWERIAG